MSVDGALMQNDPTNREEVWSAIRYLDPDERDRDAKSKSSDNATITTVIALLLVFFIWVLIWLRTL